MRVGRAYLILLLGNATAPQGKLHERAAVALASSSGTRSDGRISLGIAEEKVVRMTGSGGTDTQTQPRPKIAAMERG